MHCTSFTNSADNVLEGIVLLTQVKVAKSICINHIWLLILFLPCGCSCCKGQKDHQVISNFCVDCLANIRFLPLKVLGELDIVLSRNNYVFVFYAPLWERPSQMKCHFPVNIVRFMTHFSFDLCPFFSYYLFIHIIWIYPTWTINSEWSKRVNY